MNKFTCLTIIAIIAFLYLIISRICEAIENRNIFKPLHMGYTQTHNEDYDEFIEDVKNNPEIKNVYIDGVHIEIELNNGDTQEIYTNDQKILNDFRNIQRKLEVKNNGR